MKLLRIFIKMAYFHFFFKRFSYYYLNRFEGSHKSTIFLSFFFQRKEKNSLCTQSVCDCFAFCFSKKTWKIKSEYSLDRISQHMGKVNSMLLSDTMQTKQLLSSFGSAHFLVCFSTHCIIYKVTRHFDELKYVSCFDLIRCATRWKVFFLFIFDIRIPHVSTQILNWSKMDYVFHFCCWKLINFICVNSEWQKAPF